MVSSIVVAIIIIILALIVLRTLGMSLVSMSCSVWNALVPQLVQMLANPTMGGLVDIGTTLGSLLVTISVTLCAILAYAEMCKSMSSLLDTKRIETVFKSFLRIAVVGGIIAIWKDLVDAFTGIFNEIYVGFANGIAGSGITIHDGGIGAINQQTFEDFILDGAAEPNALNFMALMTGFTGDNIWDKFQNAITEIIGVGGLVTTIIMFIVGIIIVFKSVSTIMELGTIIITRWIRICLHLVLAPLAIATFASRDTSFIGKKYTQSFLSVLFENTLNLIVLAAFPLLFDLIFDLFNSVGLASMNSLDVHLILGVVIFNMATSALLSLVKSLDQITGHMLGMGGA